MHISPTDEILNSVIRVHKRDCIARLTVQRFENATDEARRVAVVEKLKAELAAMNFTTTKGTQP